MITSVNRLVFIFAPRLVQSVLWSLDMERGIRQDPGVLAEYIYSVRLAWLEYLTLQYNTIHASLRPRALCPTIPGKLCRLDLDTVVLSVKIC